MGTDILVKSSHIFILPTAVGYWCNLPYYSTACLNLYLSSQVYHRTHHPWTYVWDQVAIQLVWWTGVYYNTQLDLLYSSQYWLITLYLWFIYYYGYLKKSYCFGPFANEWHATIHYTSTVGIVLTQIFSRNLHS